MVIMNNVNIFAAFFVLLCLSKDCEACFNVNNHESVIVLTGSSFYKECRCMEPAAGKLRWFNGHNKEISILSLKSTSQMDLYAKDSKIEKLSLDTTEQKSELSQTKETVEKPQESSEILKEIPETQTKSDFVSEVDEIDDNVEDTVIDTDVSKRIIRENNIDIIETITTITKKETIRIDDSKKIIKTTVETNIVKEYPDGSKDVQRNVEVKTEEIVIDSSSNVDKLLSEFVAVGEPEESVSTKTEEIEQESIIIRRIIVTRIVKTKYADSYGNINKLKTVTTITTTDNYPDGSSRTKVDSSTSLTDIGYDDIIESTELLDYTQIEDKSVEVDKQEKSTTINGQKVLQIITTTTIKEILATKDKSRKKLKSTVETVTETIKPDGVTEVTKDVQVSVSDYETEIEEEIPEGFEVIGEPEEVTSTEVESVTENGIIIKRKITITITKQVYHNKIDRVKRTKTTTKTVTEDEHPDGSIIIKTSEKVSLVDESLEMLVSEKLITEDSDLDKPDEDNKVESVLMDLVPSGEPEETESVDEEVIKEKDIIIRRKIVTRVIKIKYSDNSGVLRKLKTVTTITTTDQYPDGSSRTTVDTSTTVSEIDADVMIQSQDLKGFTKVEDKTVSVDTQERTAIRDGKEIIEIVTTTTIKEILSSDDGSRKKVKTTVETVTESKLPNGVTEVTKDVKVSVADLGKDSFDENLEGFTPVGEADVQTSSETEEVVEHGITISRKTTITTIREEFENQQLRSKKIKTTVKTTIEDEHPDGTVITKKSEKVSIADVYLKVVSTEQDTELPESYIDDSEVVEDTSEESDVKNEIVQHGSLTIKRTVTTKTKRETLASSDKSIKRVRTTVETTTVDEYPDGSIETTKDVKITISEFQKTTDSHLQAALQGLSSTGKIKTSVDKKSNVIVTESGKMTQTITTYVTKEELKNNESNEVAVKTVTETITENAKEDGTVETTKDVRTQITYLPLGTGLDDWSPEELEEIAKQPSQEKRRVIEDLPLEKKEELPRQAKPKKQRSPVGEITTETDTYTKVIKEGDNEITQTITVVTTKEVISPEKIKVTVETTTVSKGSDGVTKTTKSTKTTISEFKEEFEEIIDTGESEKSFSKLSSKTGDMRSSSAASDDLDHPGISSPPSDISSRGSRAATHVWGTESSGMYYSDDDGPGSPSSTKSQIAHSPRSNLSFELDTKLPQQRESSQDILTEKDHDLSSLPRDLMSTSIYGQLPEDDSCTSSTHSEVKTEVHSLDKTVSKMTEDFLTQEKIKSASMSHSSKTSDATFLKEADEQFEKAIEEHKKVSGSEVISSITAKYELDSHSSMSHQMSRKEESSISLKDVKSESKKVTESSSSSSSSKHESRSEKSVRSESHTSKKDPIESWGKPLGLPSPILPPTQSDGKSTPKKQTASSTVLNKNKINQEKSKEAKSRASESPSKKKTPAPVYMELTYVPHHGNSYYSAVEFFKRVRARYYVFSGTEPSKEIYNALLDAKKTWEDKDLEVTIIPTYDTDVLGYWVAENEEALEKYKIDLSPSASRCTINLQDHETSCAAYRLEF